MKISPRVMARILFMAGFILLSAPLFSADGPTPFPDAKNESAWPGKGPIRVFGWMVDNRKYFWTQREKDKGAVVFVGDSLTGGWKTSDMLKAFPGMKIANRGIGGDVSRGALFRVQEDALDLKPRALVLCIGTNDLSCHADTATTEQNIVAILDKARKDNPTLPIVLCNIPPRDVVASPIKPGALADLNARIAKIAAGRELLVPVDLYTLLATADGKLIDECFAKDRIHLAAPGYEKWAGALKPAFEKLGIK